MGVGLNISMIAKVCDRESRQDSWFETRLGFFFLACHFFETTEICFGSTKMEISTGEKSISHREKIGKSDFAPPPLKIFLFYASVSPLHYYCRFFFFFFFFFFTHPVEALCSGITKCLQQLADRARVSKHADEFNINAFKTTNSNYLCKTICNQCYKLEVYECNMHVS